MSNSKFAKFTLDCSEFDSTQVRQAFLELSVDSRFDNVEISIASGGAPGIKPGTYRLTDIFKTMSCDVEPAINDPDDDVLLNDESVGIDELLFECHEMIRMMSESEQFKDTVIKVESTGSDVILDKGNFGFADILQSLAFAIEDASDQ